MNNKPLSLIIAHTIETLPSLSVARRIELLEALHCLSVDKGERALLRQQIESLQAAERDQAQLLLDLHAQRIRRAA